MASAILDIQYAFQWNLHQKKVELSELGLRDYYCETENTTAVMWLKRAFQPNLKTLSPYGYFLGW